MKRPQDTKAGNSISAFVILKKGKHIANVRAHYGDSGTVTVEVHEFGKDPQLARAGGYGYDKFVTALRGMTIDGHRMTNHSEEFKPMPRGGFKRDARIPKGWRTCNWSAELQAYTSCYKTAGLDYLREIGYTVIQNF